MYTVRTHFHRKIKNNKIISLQHNFKSKQMRMIALRKRTKFVVMHNYIIFIKQ